MASLNPLRVFTAVIAVLILFAGFFGQAQTTSSTNLAPVKKNSATKIAAAIEDAKNSKKKKQQEQKQAVKNTRAIAKPVTPIRVATKVLPKTQPKVIAKKTPFAAKPLAKKPVPTPAKPMAKQEAIAPVETQNSWVAQPVQTAKPPPKPLSAAFILASGRSMTDFQDGTYKEGLDYIGSFGWKFTPDWSASVVADYFQDTHDPTASDWADTQLGLGYKAIKISNAFNLTFAGVGVLPTSKDSSINRTLKGAGGGAATFGFNEGVLIPELSLSLGFGLTRFFHEYETGLDGKANSPWSTSQTFEAVYTLGKFSLDGKFVHKSSLNYQNNVKEAFLHAEELSYKVMKKVTVALGHTLEGSMYKPNGVDSNVSVTDENNSLVYAALSISY